MKRYLILLVLPAASMGAVRDHHARVTNTQAVLRYVAPGDSACKLELSRSASYSSLAADVNPVLFDGSDSDTRSGNVVRGRERQFVIGKRTAERAADGRMYSRALEANTAYYYRIRCGSDTAEGAFTTQNLALGATYNDPLPAGDPGEYAWPSLSWTDRNVTTTDPHTGVLLHGLTLPRDRYEDNSGGFGTPVDRDDAWTNESNVGADDSAAATFSGTDNSWLFLPAGINVWNGGRHAGTNGSLNSLEANLNAWCSGAGCDTATSSDRTIQACLSVDGVSCGTGMIEYTLAACTSNCTGDIYRFTLGDTTAILAAWKDPTFDLTSVHGRTGYVNRTGAAVTRTSGLYFDTKWSAGSRIIIGGTVYPIASVDSPTRITLAGAPAGGDSNAAFSAPNFGLLIRKKTASTHQISLQYASHRYEIGNGAAFDTAGDGRMLTECSETTVPGPGGEQGYHCHISGSLYWIGRDTGTAALIGNLRFPYRAGTDGWSSDWCHGTGGAYFDPANADIFHCAMTDNSSNRILVAATYHGANTEIGPQHLNASLAECNGGMTNQPCYAFENVTPASQNKSITQQVAAFHPEWNTSPVAMRQWSLFGQQGGYLGLYAKSADTNDVLGWFAMFKVSSRQIVSAAPSWKYWPFRWSTLHGASPVGSPDWMFFTGHIANGPFSGADAYGRGPWRTTVTSGAIPNTASACPARPADSPIPAGDWPAGNQCVQITVAGEPCDPSPNGEATNPAKCGNATDGYLMDAEVRDVFCASNDPTQHQNGCQFYAWTEVFRLIVKNGNTWTLERAFSTDGVQKPMLPLNAGATLVAIPPSCSLSTYPCDGAAGYWNFTANPHGYNDDGSGFVIDRITKGGGHGTLSSNGMVSSVMSEGCPSIDGQGNGCYAFRSASLPGLFTTLDSIGSNNPAFAGLTGIGQPNEVDSHPSQPSPSTGTWFTDARPFLGHAGATGTSESGGTLVTGSLYRFTAAQLPRLRRKQLPTLAACGSHPLLDISGPTSVIGGIAPDNYKYCVANAAGECHAGSSAGDAYVNCPQIENRYCHQLPIGSENYDADNICIADNGAYTQGVLQGDYSVTGQTGAGSRLLTHALSAYRLSNIFWNVKGTPDGRWLIIQSPWLDGQRAETILARSLPAGDTDTVNRAGFVPVQVAVRPPPGLQVSNAVVEFGNNADFHCTSRREVCVKGNQAGSYYGFASESVTGVPCEGGCTVTIPGIPQRSLYYRVRYRNVANQVIASGAPSVTVVQ